MQKVQGAHGGWVDGARVFFFFGLAGNTLTGDVGQHSSPLIKQALEGPKRRCWAWEAHACPESRHAVWHKTKPSNEVLAREWWSGHKQGLGTGGVGSLTWAPYR